MLKQLREARGLSQRDLAVKAKVSGAYIAQLETGVRKNPSLAVLKRLAKALGVPVGELME
ncbi:MAG TPA: helix-turn-helix transcriptional regulator [Candidatus Methylomirabilis sp.]|nr:helix-turn-helix transcriptional regulator [Candidatus Methylomirabilis sp.]